MSLSEERIRIIVREELSTFVDNLGKKVGVPQHLEVEKMEDTMVTIVQTISQEEAAREVGSHEVRDHGH